MPIPIHRYQSKLDTLAQELSMLLVPETFWPNDFKAARVENCSEALASEGRRRCGAGSLDRSPQEKNGPTKFDLAVGFACGSLSMVEEPLGIRRGRRCPRLLRQTVTEEA